MPDPSLTWRTTIGLIALLIAGSASGQDTALPRFQIELIVFENLSTPPTREAPVIPDIARPPPVIEQSYLQSGNADPGTSPPSPPPPGKVVPDADQASPIFFELAPELTMNNIAASLQRNSAYRVLLHDAWIQDGFEGDAAQPVDISRLEQLESAANGGRRNAASNAAMLTGTVTFYRGRYLHLDLDLRLGEGAGRLLQERRRVRLGEAGYFDAPKLGVIAMVTRADQTGEAGSD